MKNDQPTNSHILDPKCSPLGFIVGDWNDINSFYAAVPCGNGLMVIHQGRQLKNAETQLAPVILSKSIEKNDQLRDSLYNSI